MDALWWLDPVLFVAPAQNLDTAFLGQHVPAVVAVLCLLDVDDTSSVLAVSVYSV